MLALELVRVGVAAGLAIVVTAALAGEADILGGVPFDVGLADLGPGICGWPAARRHPAARRGRPAERARIARGVAAAAGLGPGGLRGGGARASQAGVVPLGLPLSTERGLIAGAGVLSLVVGGLVAVAQEDIDRAVVYSIAQDAGFALVAFAGTDATVWEPARSWLLIFAVTKTAFLAWAVAMGITFGTRSLDGLRGWVRRAPLLAVTLVLVALATIGLPGMAAFEVRSELLSAVLSSPLRLVIGLASFGGLLVYGRLLLVGFGEPSALVFAAPDERPRRFVAEPIPPPPAWTRPASQPSRSARRPRSPAFATARGTIAVNRTPITASLALGLAAVALVFGAGLFDLRYSAGLERAAAAARRAAGPAGRTDLPTHSHRAAADGLAVRSHALGFRGAEPCVVLTKGGREGAYSPGASAQRSISRSYSTSSPGRNHSASSVAAVSGPSDAWTRFCAVSSAKSPRIVPGAASCGRVEPIIVRTTAMAFGPSRAKATSGLEVMKSTRLRKNGRSRWTA